MAVVSRGGRRRCHVGCHSIPEGVQPPSASTEELSGWWRRGERQRHFLPSAVTGSLSCPPVRLPPGPHRLLHSTAVPRHSFDDENVTGLPHPLSVLHSDLTEPSDKVPPYSTAHFSASLSPSPSPSLLLFFLPLFPRSFGCLHP